MADTKGAATDGPQNLTITTSADDRAVLADLERLTGGSNRTELIKRALRDLQTKLLREEAERVRLRAELEGGAS